MPETDLWTKLKSSNKKIVLYGTGNGADKIIACLEKYDIGVDGIFASNGFVRDREFHGIKVKSYEQIKEEFGEIIVLMCFGSSRPEVIDFVKLIMSENEFYLPDVPVYGDIIFNSEYYLENINRFKETEKKLEDSISVRTYRNIIQYKLSGDVRYLFDTETTEDEEESIVNLSDKSILIDCGAYNGDTVRKYKRVYGDKLSKIIAVEPDKRNYRKLCAFTENMTEVHTINAAVSDTDGIVVLQDNSGRGVHIDGNSVFDKEKDNKVDVMCVDTVTEKYIADDTAQDILIKFDVEGNEIKALSGAKNTIEKYRPKMVIACYHRNDDMFKIPETVFAIRDDYKMKIRHLPGLPCWDTQFYFY